MKFPSTDDFLEKLGIEPAEEDPSMAYCRYVSCGCNGEELDISFSDVSESFQIIMRINDDEIINVYSENVQSIVFREEKSSLGLHVLFDIDGIDSHVWVQFEPRLKVHWSTLSNNPKRSEIEGGRVV